MAQQCFICSLHVRTPHYTSAHPMSTKRTVLNSEIKRVIKVSSDNQARHRSKHRVNTLFEHNGYPTAMLDKSIKNNLHKRTYHTNLRKKENMGLTRVPCGISQVIGFQPLVEPSGTRTSFLRSCKNATSSVAVLVRSYQIWYFFDLSGTEVRRNKIWYFFAEIHFFAF